eukprot:TRINITY_DN1658_c0_g1_i1.p1 TRINITY_DN1658_c0_g1~~TRINITY_DN1658_c0_g1_i1.p1  ORF type:complete len:1165 (+),score=318.11 TRINITY_DN1658_c0_g1_i1:305-3496(+)
MCQAANIGSLEHVVNKFRAAAEAKVALAQKEMETKMSDMADLDENEAPQTILLRAIQASDTRQQSQDRDVHIHYRFCWDAYKVVLDVLKSNAKIEECYHETAKHAFNFCQVNQRPQEFKRLCDTLRKNYQDLQKYSGKAAAHQVNPNNVDTITRTLETRVKQLQTATELDLWREAYVTAGEIYELISKARPKPHLRSMYYGYLGKIFWKSDNYLFHAFACVKNLMFVKAAKQNISSDELESLASKAVLATLCVPFEKDSGLQSSLELTSDSGSSAFEKARKHAVLFSAQSVPTRESISSSLIEKGLLGRSAKACQKLFALVESEFTPLSLCQDAKPFLDEIAKGDLFDGALVQYVTPLKQIIFFRLMKQLSEVYSNMTIENFEAAASIVPFNIAEKWMANAARQHGINIQINYQQHAIVFGAPRKVDMKSMRQPLVEIGTKLQTAMNRVAPEESGKKERLEKQQLSASIVKRIEEECRQIKQRKEEIERRKEEREKKRQAEEAAALEKQRKQEAKEAEAEKVRQEEERRRREAERAEQKRKEAEMVKNKEMLEQMKKQADSAKAANLKVGGKKITEIEAEDLKEIGIEQIEKAREAQVIRERQDKIRNRKMESKRVDHLARALREEEQKLLSTWQDEVEERDQEFLQLAEDKAMESLRSKHENELEERDMMRAFWQAKKDWSEPQMEERSADYEEMKSAQEHRLTKKVVAAKIARAKARLETYRKEEHTKQEKEKQKLEAQRRREEEERRREEEERQRAEEEERRKVEDEERRVQQEARRKEREEKRKEEDEMRARADAKRAEREREIEERQAQQQREKRDERSAPKPKPDAQKPAPWRRGGDTPSGGGGASRPAPKEEEGSWRRGSDSRDDAPAKGGARGGGGRDGPKESDGGAWRRPERTSGGEDTGGAWRRPERTAAASGAGEDESGWRQQGSSRAAAPARESKVSEAPPRREAAPAEEKTSAANAEDDEWAVAVNPKRRGAKTGGGGAGGAAGGDDNWRGGGGAGGEKGGGKASQARDPPAKGGGRGEEGSWRAPGGPRAGGGNEPEKRPSPPWKKERN